MNWDFIFLFNSLLLGVGLAMDAFSVSLANGLNEPKMKASKMTFVAGVFAVMQGIMPLIGWVCVHTVVQYFSFFEKLIPWIALILLCYIGVHMIKEAKECEDCPEDCKELGFKALFVQGIATSIDALSVGFTIADYGFIMALAAVLIIAAVTFVICFGGVAIGKKFGTKLAGRAGVFGGVILIFIGLEIFITNLF